VQLGGGEAIRELDIVVAELGPAVVAAFELLGGESGVQGRFLPPAVAAPVGDAGRQV
jgi:hypothetical protein